MKFISNKQIQELQTQIEKEPENLNASEVIQTEIAFQLCRIADILDNSRKN